MSPTQVSPHQKTAPQDRVTEPAKPGEGAARYSPGHLAGLRRFAIAITVLTILGHGVLGFEQSYAQPLVSLAAAYSTQLLLEWLTAWSERRRPRFAGGPAALVNFLLSAHITGLAVAMLLYFNDRLWDIAFASAVAIASKTVFRAGWVRNEALFQPLELWDQRYLAAVPCGGAGDAVAVHRWRNWRRRLAFRRDRLLARELHQLSLHQAHRGRAGVPGRFCRAGSPPRSLVRYAARWRC